MCLAAAGLAYLDDGLRSTVLEFRRFYMRQDVI